MKAKYFIYHVPGVKIGVSNNPEYRVTGKQGFTEYEILEEHTNIKTVSQPEIELQKQYGYPVDKKPYWKVVQMQKKCTTKEARKKAIANTDFKAKVAKIDWVSYSQKRDWSKMTLSHWHTPEVNKKRKETRSKINWKEVAKKRDYIKTSQAVAKARSKPVNQYDLENNFIKRWDSATAAANSLNKRPSDITGCCTGRLKTAHKFIWKYA